MEGDDEEEEEGSLTEKSQDEAPESPSPVPMTTGVYEEDDEEEEAEATPLAMSYEHTRRYTMLGMVNGTLTQLQQKLCPPPLSIVITKGSPTNCHLTPQ